MAHKRVKKFICVAYELVVADAKKTVVEYVDSTVRFYDTLNQVTPR